MPKKGTANFAPPKLMVYKLFKNMLLCDIRFESQNSDAHNALLVKIKQTVFSLKLCIDNRWLVSYT